MHPIRSGIPLLLLALSTLAPWSLSQSEPSETGDLTAAIDFPTALQAVRAVLVEDPPSGLGLHLAETTGRPDTLQSAPHEYASGTLAGEHLAKIARSSEISDGTWQRVRYTLFVRVEPLGKKEVHITPDVQIEAQKRTFTGQTQWVPMASNRNIEQTFALGLGRRLFGPQFTLKDKRKFWERDPRYVPDPAGGGSDVARPDTKRW